MQNQERAKEIRELRERAAAALRQEQFEEALENLAKAIALDPGNQELLNIRNTIQESKVQKERFAAALNRAQSERQAGNFTQALAAADQALSVQSDDANTNAARAAIEMEAAERRLRNQVEGLLNQARDNLSARRFAQAISFIDEAERLAPADPTIHELRELVTTISKSDERRRRIDDWSAKIEEALNQDEYPGACLRAEQALQEFPEHSEFLKLKALAEKQREAAEKRRRVHEQVTACRDLLVSGQSAAALARIEDAVQRFPEESALQSLLALAKQAIAHSETDVRKRDLLQRAREAITRADYETAIQALEEGRSEFGTKEIDELLRFAREEQAASETRKRIEEIRAEAHRLSSQGEHEEALALVESKLKESPGEELRTILTAVKGEAANHKAKVQEAVAEAQRLLRDARFNECLAFLNSQPASFLRDPALRDVSQAVLREHRRWETITSTKQKVREAIWQHDFVGADGILKDCERSFGDSIDLKLIRGELESKWVAHANRFLEKTLVDARMLLMDRSHADALKVLGFVTSHVSHASDELKKQYEEMWKKCQAGLEEEQKLTEKRMAALVGAGGETVLITPFEAEGELHAKASPVPGGTIILPVPGSQDKLAPKPTVAKSSQRSTPRAIYWGVAALILLVLSGILVAVAKGRWASIPVTIYTKPEGATVHVDRQRCTTPHCELRLNRGQHQVEARLAGYEPASTTLTVSSTAQQKKGVEVKLELKPVPQLLQISSNFGAGRVRLDNTEVGALQNGQFLLQPLGAGKHTIRVSAEDGEVELPLDAPAGRAPVVDGGIKTNDVRAITISTSSEGVVVACNCSIDAVSIDDRALGKLTSAGLQAGALILGAHTLAVGEGKNQTRFTFEVRPQPAITLYLTTNRNTGMLVIVAGVPDAEIFIDGIRYSGGNQGVLQLPIEAKEHVVRVRKNGYDSPPDQRVEIRRNRETRLVFKLQLKRFTVTISGAALGTQISVDDKPVGSVQADGRAKFEIIPGKHLISLERPGYEPAVIEAQLTPGQELRLAAPDMKPVAPPPPAPIATAKKIEDADRDWAALNSKSDVSALEGYVQKHPDGPHADEAIAILTRLREADYCGAAVSETPPSAAAQTSDDDRFGIADVLRKYCVAFLRRDANLLASIWPSLQHEQLKRLEKTFKQVQTVRIELRAAGDPIISGDRAQVRCTRLLQYGFASGTQDPIHDGVTFRLRKRKGLWLMESVN